MAPWLCGAASCRKHPTFQPLEQARAAVLLVLSRLRQPAMLVVVLALVRALVLVLVLVLVLAQGTMSTLTQTRREVV